ncbi:sugar ABC transporter ATP-binding protein [Sinanaerobacter chloroacetimidivorans]|uniref:Ribose/galactose/methyl galactoside import ATP-binding protein n=1 Tax=Sinanaerobacter chloroacetimidivorans TaxID=2818044 RepID=A0A8J7W821_9FIRM|nr:sugar ABC transporter ATP-binding protein [Sinanaerobacter chloroacetimidivorans]MBR0600646.1 sugar ABC transporter ATP-binding protein [Sinanaerobacter chloroacetimidivorans]
MEEKNILVMKDIVKTFPGVKALKGVDLNVKYGEIHALMGENGAGKSTLMKCLIGIHPPTSGQIYYEGQLIENYSTAEALKMGIAMIHQELSPVEHRSIMENIWLGREPKTKLGLVDHKKMYEMTKEVLKLIDFNEDPKTLMVNLTVAKMQMIEIAKALSYNAKLIIMDEPTSALTNKEIIQLFSIMRRLKENGKSIIYISHKLEEIYEICDRITVYRDGQYIGEGSTADMQVNELIKMMVGREVNEMFPKVACEIGEVKMEVKGLSYGKKFQDVSFDVRKGEILGIAGLVGAGRTEVIETIFGIREKSAGQIIIDGKEVKIQTPKDAKANKMALLTEDRRVTGIFPMLSVFQNVIIANLKKYIKKNGLLDHKTAIKDTNEFVDAIKIKTPSINQKIENLSGGNQQKVLVARWLLTSPEILFLDEPTRGIDVGAKSEIHRLITNLAGQGKSIIMVSSELPEVMGMSDRIMIMHEGKVTGIIENHKDLTQEEIMTYATGQVPKLA